MRVRFRIAIYEKEGKRLSKEDILDQKDALHIGIRYITEFKYLEATKWLMLSGDCREKYLLLSLINLALGQETEGYEFMAEALKYPSTTKYLFAIERPEKNLRLFIERPEVSLPDFLLSL
ncbi:MAG: hypothetical protein ACK4OF_05680 [Aquificaceae bacterium]